MKRLAAETAFFCCLVLFFPVCTVQAAPLPDRNNPSAHWTLNEADYDGNYIDTIAGYIAQPTSPTLLQEFATNQTER